MVLCNLRRVLIGRSHHRAFLWQRECQRRGWGRSAGTGVDHWPPRPEDRDDFFGAVRSVDSYGCHIDGRRKSFGFIIRMNHLDEVLTRIAKRSGLPNPSPNNRGCLPRRGLAE